MHAAAAVRIVGVVATHGGRDPPLPLPSLLVGWEDPLYPFWTHRCTRSGTRCGPFWDPPL